MAKVWFVRRENRLVALGGRPAYTVPLDSLIWPLDLGLHRFYATPPPALDAGSAPSPDTLRPEDMVEDMVLVELTPADIPADSSYTVGFYSSPYSPRKAIERLGTPWAS